MTVDLVADMATINPFDFFVDDDAVSCGRSSIWSSLANALRPYLEALPGTPLPRKHISPKYRGPAETYNHRFRHRSQRRTQPPRRLSHAHGSRRSDGGRNAAGKSGSCRDTGWLLVQILRHLGLAARFVSGYLIQLAPDQESPDTTAKTDTADLHAWAEVYMPGAGWIGLDPTSGLFAGEGHIPLATTPSPLTAAPITGSQ